MAGKKSEKRPRPSYEDGKLRDPSIEAKQDKGFKRAGLLALIRRAVRHSQQGEGQAPVEGRGA